MESFALNNFFKTYFFWILLTVASLLGCVFTYFYFPYACPIIDITITMNRNEALNKAKALAQKNMWGPIQYQQAASFQSNEEVKNFIELEGGGPKVLKEILKEHYYFPYFWTVRHFQENDPEETLIYFTPEGDLYGFNNKISEAKPGAALTSLQAQEIVEKKAPLYNVDLTQYTLVESSQEIKISGRIDHLFVYHNRTKKITGQPYRLRIMVSGDTMTELTLSLKVPEAFTRRYNDMRSSNKLISFIANIVMFIVYLLCISTIGFLYLLRNNALLIKPAFIWAFIIAFLQSINTLNSIPLWWMSYDTALNKNSFLINILTMCCLQFFIMLAILTIIFAVAEGLTRKAFPHHLQFWKLWSEKAGSSWEVLGRTIGGYIIVGIDLAIVTSIYYVASLHFGWWTPSETLYNPDILATYMPWFSSICQSLGAGFIEETLFRAIPLAAGALLGSYFNKRSWGIAIAFIIQVLVFGAAHANYPTQPAYARLLELIIPSSVFGFLYLRFGLLPAIISHFTFDVFWFALPLFVSQAPGVMTNRALVIFFSAIPLLILFYRRIQYGSWHNLAKEFYNNAWEKRVPEKNLHEPTVMPPTIMNFDHKIHYSMLIFSLCAVAAWFFVTPFTYDNDQIKITQSEALQAANTIIEKIDPTIIKNWHHDITIETELDNQHLFVWQENRPFYKKFLSSYLPPALWKIRYAQFNEEVDKREEEYSVYLNGNGTVVRINHHIPEERPGKDLSLTDARTLAHNFLEKMFTVDKQNIQEVSAVPTKQSNRTDWIFTFADKQHLLGHKAEARITITINGDEIVDYNRSVFVPDEWARNERQRELILFLVTLISFLILGLLLSFFLKFNLIKQWRFPAISASTTLIFFIILLLKSLIQLYLLWPTFVSSFTTTEPYTHQLFRLLVTVFMQIIIKAGLLSMIAGFSIHAHAHIKQYALTPLFGIYALSWAIIFTTLTSLLRLFLPSLNPLWPDYIPAAAAAPWLSFILINITSFITIGCIFLVITTFIDVLTHGGTKNSIWCMLICIVTSVTGLSFNDPDSLRYLLISGFIIGLFGNALYYFLLRFNKALIPLFVWAMVTINIIQKITFNVYPGIYLGGIMSIIIIFFGALWWSYQLDARKN